MPSDAFIAQRQGRCAHVKEIGWDKYYGTTDSGNLPGYDINSNPCGITIASLNQGIVNQLGITERDFRPNHIKCAYSTESNVNEVLDLSPLSGTYGQIVDVSSTASHTVTGGVMIRFSRGSKHGWLCVDDACPFYQTNDRRYFYI